MAASTTKVLAEQESKPRIMNPMTWLWRKLVGDPFIRLKMGEMLKMAEIAIVTSLAQWSMNALSLTSFIKNKLHNCLGHLDCMVCMYTQWFFSLQDFPFQDSINHWLDGECHRGLGR